MKCIVSPGKAIGRLCMCVCMHVSGQWLHMLPFITGPPNGPVLFCSLASVVCRHRLSSGAWAVWWPTLHGRPV